MNVDMWTCPHVTATVDEIDKKQDQNVLSLTCGNRFRLSSSRSSTTPIRVAPCGQRPHVHTFAASRIAPNQTLSGSRTIMGLTLVASDHLLCPTFVCDQCGDPIVGVDGIVLWNPTYIASIEIIGQLFFVHRGNCDRQFSSARRPVHFWSRELDQFAAQLAHNTKHALKARRADVDDDAPLPVHRRPTRHWPDDYRVLSTPAHLEGARHA